MKRTICIVCVCLGALLMLFGTTFSFEKVSESADNVRIGKETLVFDVSAVGLFGTICGDFFKGADYFTMAVVENDDGSVEIQYQSLEYRDIGNDSTELVNFNSDIFTIYPVGYYPTDEEIDRAYLRIREPIRPFIEWERQQYDGVFLAVLQVLQFLAYILGMIWGALSIVMIIAVDTIAVAWQVVKLGLAILGMG